MRTPVALVVVIAAAGAIATVVAMGQFAGQRAPTAVIDGWPIGAPRGICADSVCAQMTRLGLAALDERYPTHAAVLSSALYGLGACVEQSTGHTDPQLVGGPRTDEVFVVTLADGAVHAFGVGGGGSGQTPSVAPPLDAPYCSSAMSGPGEVRWPGSPPPTMSPVGVAHRGRLASGPRGAARSDGAARYAART